MRAFRYTVLACSLALLQTLAAQRQLWGYLDSRDSEAPFHNGGLWYMDLNTFQYTYLSPFDTATFGSLPPWVWSGPMVASNDKVYGITSGPLQTGVLYCYDLITDSLHVAANFGTAQYPSYSSTLQLVEGLPGQLFGCTYPQPSSTIFRFYTATDSLELCVNLPSENFNGTTYSYAIRSPFQRANDGRLYSVRFAGPTGLAASRVVKIDPLSNLYSPSTYAEAFDFTQGIEHNGDFVEQNGYFYSTAARGGAAADTSRGVIYKYDISTGDYTKMLDFTPDMKNPPTGMVDGGAGRFYGIAFGADETTENGVLYSYDPLMNAIDLVQDLSDPSYNDSRGMPWYNLLAASNDKIYGTYELGLFEYDHFLDTLILRAPLSFTNSNGTIVGHGSSTKMIEICRKPNYKPHSTTNFNVCAGAHYFYDLQNVNATSVVWRRNGSIVPSQTDQRLEFTAITEGDEGVWTCTLTNECGVTEPPAITITVNTGAFSTSTISGDTLLCGTGDVALLSGNSGGTWAGPIGSGVNGAATPNAIADLPGLYHVWNTQSCGISLSDAIEVVHLDSAQAPDQAAGLFPLCAVQLPYTFYGNDPGPWGNLPTGAWPDGSVGTSYTVTDTGYVYLVSSNACNSDTSGILQVVFPEENPQNQVTFTDAFGLPADRYLCGTDSVSVSIVDPSLGATYVWTLPDFSNVFGATMINASLPGNYVLSGNGVCEPNLVEFTIHADEFPPQVGQIIPDQDVFSGCPEDAAFLASSIYPCYWNSVGNGQFANDTSVTVQVDWSATQYVLTPFNGCGNGPQDVINIAPLPGPDVQFDQAEDTICLNGGAITLAAGVPAGGVYSGPGVSGNIFDPQQAGIGEHTITYSYDDGTCTGYGQDVVVVDICTEVPEMIVHAESIIVKPNPNNGVFHVSFTCVVEQGSVTVFDTQGRCVMPSMRLVPGTNQVNTGDLRPGVYTLRIELEDEVDVRSVVITNDLTRSRMDPVLSKTTRSCSLSGGAPILVERV